MMITVSYFKLNTKNLIIWFLSFTMLMSIFSVWNSLKSKRMIMDRKQEKEMLEAKVFSTEKKVKKRATPPPTPLPNFELPHLRKFELCSSIEKLINHSSIADFGAGWGLFGRCWLRRHRKEDFFNETFHNTFIEGMKAASLHDKPQVVSSWEGFDNTADIKAITKGWVNSLNLELPFGLAKQFDWVVSLDVLQYIDPDKKDFFFDNLYTHAKKGIILSWTNPEVKKPPPFNRSTVIDRMKARGLVQDTKEEELVKKRLNDTYYKNTLMIFKFGKRRK